MQLPNCKIDLKLKWAKFYVLTVAGANNNDSSSNDIFFTIKDTKLYISNKTGSGVSVNQLN